MSISPSSPDGQVLSRELSEFLLDFLGAQQRFAMYPVGHPRAGQPILKMLNVDTIVNTDLNAAAE